MLSAAHYESLFVEPLRVMLLAAHQLALTAKLLMSSYVIKSILTCTRNVKMLSPCCGTLLLLCSAVFSASTSWFPLIVTWVFISFIVLMASLCHGLNQVPDTLRGGGMCGTDCLCM